MDFKKKLKIRLYKAISFILIGIILIFINNISLQNDFLSSFGFAWVVIGIARVKQYFIITKNEESIKKQEIAEKDERNIAIANKARSLSFAIYILSVSAVIIVLSVIGIHKETVLTLSYSVCFLVLVYWISYFIIRKKN